MAKPVNEPTASPALAKLAARILAAPGRKAGVAFYLPGTKGSAQPFAVYWAQVRAMAGFILNAAADQPKPDEALDPREGGGPKRLVRGKWVDIKT